MQRDIQDVRLIHRGVTSTDVLASESQVASDHHPHGETTRENEPALCDEPAKTETMTIQERDVHSCLTASFEADKNPTDANRSIPECSSARLPKQRR